MQHPNCFEWCAICEVGLATVASTSISWHVFAFLVWFGQATSLSTGTIASMSCIMLVLVAWLGQATITRNLKGVLWERGKRKRKLQKRAAAPSSQR
eukprot:2762302-Lingulodinium_polyedra.AAC.1